MLLVVSMI